MSHHVHAAEREGLIDFCAPGDRGLSSAFRLQRLFDFFERQAIHDVLFGEPAFAGDADPEPQILQTRSAMSIRIDHAFNAFLLG